MAALHVLAHTRAEKGYGSRENGKGVMFLRWSLPAPSGFAGPSESRPGLAGPNLSGYFPGWKCWSQAGWAWRVLRGRCCLGAWRERERLRRFGHLTAKLRNQLALGPSLQGWCQLWLGVLAACTIAQQGRPRARAAQGDEKPPFEHLVRRAIEFSVPPGHLRS